MAKKIVIVGGVAGGATAAARLRRLDEKAEIILVERGEHISFANCGLPYYIGEVIEEREHLLVQTVEGMEKRFRLDIRVKQEVIRIDRDKKNVVIKNLKTGETYEESYDYLILSPGARPIVPPIPGLHEANNIYTLRNIPDTDAIKKHVDEEKPDRAVVVGGGFIGLEMAENFALRGMDVTIVEMADQVMAPLDPEMAGIVHEHLEEKGINLILNDGVKAFSDEGRTITLSSGKTLQTDLTLLSIGVQPESELAKEAGLSLGERGGIQVNEYLQTLDEAIYAIGDVIETKDYILQERTMIPLAGPANRQGRIVANNIYGRKEKYRGTLGSSVAKVFDLTVASTGINEKGLKQREKVYQAIHIHPMSHASYYPGASTLSLKVLFHPETGKIYGAQAIGKKGVEKRMDVIATAIMGDLTVFELADLELSYAPPYSSAKDPVNMIGYIAQNIVWDGIETVQWYEIDEIVQKGGFLLDVRGPRGFQQGNIPGAYHIPLPELRNRLDEIPKDRTIYTTCRSGLDSYVAARILKGYGYDVKNLDGSYLTYRAGYGLK